MEEEPSWGAESFLRRRTGGLNVVSTGIARVGQARTIEMWMVMNRGLHRILLVSSDRCDFAVSCVAVSCQTAEALAHVAAAWMGAWIMR